MEKKTEKFSNFFCVCSTHRFVNIIKTATLGKNLTSHVLVVLLMRYKRDFWSGGDDVIEFWFLIRGWKSKWKRDKEKWLKIR